ncbi:MAG: TolC family protein [Acidobacteria bacterium]|nr:TolC family protein [Acidobacteriota bacterium]
MRRTVILWIGLALAGLAPLGLAARAAGADPLTLEQAMARAREQSREVLAASARADAGAARLRQAKGHRLPQVSLEEIWMHTDSPAEAFALQLNQERFSFADFVSGDPNDPKAIDNALTRLEVSLPLYTGGELKNRIGQASLAAEAADERARRVADDAAAAAAQAWVQLALAREQAALLERSLETVEAHVSLVGAYVDQGLLVRSDLLRAQVEKARLEDLLAAAKNGAQVAEANLSLRLGADVTASWDLAPLADPGVVDEDLESWLATVDERRDLEAARRELEAAELEVAVQRSALLPKVGLVARHDFNDDTPFGTAGDSTAVMAVAKIELFAGGRHRAAAAAARADVDAGRLELELFRQGLRVQVRDAYATAVSARRRHVTAAAARDAAVENERIVGERFKKGVVKVLDLLDATNTRRETETRELAARADAHLAALNLALAAGREPESVLPAAATSSFQTTSNDAGRGTGEENGSHD